MSDRRMNTGDVLAIAMFGLLLIAFVFGVFVFIAAAFGAKAAVGFGVLTVVGTPVALALSKAEAR